MKKIFLLSSLSLLLLSCEKDDILPTVRIDPPANKGIVTYPDATTETVTICNQVWSTKNLNVIAYRDGTPIKDASVLSSDPKNGIWSWPGNDSIKYGNRGRMYNYSAVSNPRNIAPVGYHVPTLAEWYKLLNCLDPNGSQKKYYYKAANYLKQAGYSNWKKTEDPLIYPDIATNSSRFTAVPAGVAKRRIWQASQWPTKVFIDANQTNEWAYILTADGYIIQMNYLTGVMDMGFQVESSKNHLDKYDLMYSVRLIKD